MDEIKPQYHLFGYVSDPISRDRSYVRSFSNYNSYSLSNYNSYSFYLSSPNCNGSDGHYSQSISTPKHGDFYSVCPVGPGAHGAFQQPR